MADNILSAKINVTTTPGTTAAFNNTAAAALKTENALKRVVPGANQATAAFTGLARVAQDAPFGFIAIANNLTELPALFARVSMSAKESGTSIKSALVASLAGPGGLILGLSLLTAGLSFAQNGLGQWGKMLGISSDKTDAAAEAAKKYAEAVSSVFRETAKEATQVATMVGLLKSETESRERKLLAIKELQRIQPEVFTGLKLEGEAVVGLDNAYKNYIANLSNVLAIKLKQLKLEELLTKQLQNQGATLTKSEKDALNSLKATNKEIITETGFRVKDESDIVGFKNFQIKQAEESKKLESDIAAIIGDIAELSKGVKLPGEGKAKDIKDTKFEYDALYGIFKNLLAIQKLFTAELEKQAQRRKQIKIDFAGFKDGGTFTTASAFDNFAKEIPAVSERLQKTIEEMTKRNPILIKANVNYQLLLDNEARIKKQVEELNDIVRNTAIDAFTGIGEDIGEALAGGDVQKGFSGFINAIASGIQAIGKQFIKVGALAILAKQAFTKLFANPALSIAVGVALVAAGAALRKSLEARALGGPVGKNKPYLVGENGPELFIPDTGGKIVSNQNLRSTGGGSFMNAGASVQVVGQLLLRGNDLVAALANANRSQGRLT